MFEFNENTLAIIVVIVYLIIILIMFYLVKSDMRTNYTILMARGLNSILQRFDSNTSKIESNTKDFDSVYFNVERFYEQFIEAHPKASKYFPNIAIWIDYIIMEINLEYDYISNEIKNNFTLILLNKFFDLSNILTSNYRRKSKLLKKLEEQMPILIEIQIYIHKNKPFYKGSEYQQMILSDIKSICLKNSSDDNNDIVNNAIKKVEDEFLKQEREIRKNDIINKLSVCIGVLGIVVSIILYIFS